MFDHGDRKQWHAGIGGLNSIRLHQAVKAAVVHKMLDDAVLCELLFCAIFIVGVVVFAVFVWR